MAEEASRSEEIGLLKLNLEQQKKVLDAHIKALQAEFDDKKAALQRKVQDEKRRKDSLDNNRKLLRTLRTVNEKERSGHNE